MKNHILLITFSIIFFTFWGVANAQTNQIGIIGGINLAYLYEKDVEYNSRTGLLAGGVVEFGKGEKVSFCFEPMYLQKGAIDKLDVKSHFECEFEVEGTIEVKLTYLEIPVFFKLPVGMSTTKPYPYIMAGPTFGILLSSKMKMSTMGIDIEVDTKDLTESIDYGFGFGGGVSFPIGSNSLFIEARYTLGLADIVKRGEIEIGGQKQTIPDALVKTRGYQIIAGISMPLGGK